MQRTGLGGTEMTIWTMVASGLVAPHGAKWAALSHCPRLPSRFLLLDNKILLCFALISIFIFLGPSHIDFLVVLTPKQ